MLTIDYYDEVMASTYDKDPFGLIASTQEKAFSQLVALLGPRAKVSRLLDVALGTGESFVRARELFEVGELIGNDLSAQMLSYSAKKVSDFQAIQGSALDVGQRLSAGSVDVVLVHLVLSYVDLQALLDELMPVLKPGGVISITTSTKAHLRDIQDRVLKGASYLYPTKMMGALAVPDDAHHLEQVLEASGFSVVAKETIAKELMWEDFDSLWEYAAEVGWHVQYTQFTGYRWLDKSLFRALCFLLDKCHPDLSFPLRGTTDLAVLTAKKKT